MKIPTPSGPYFVSTKTFTIKDDNRKEIFGPHPGEETHLITSRIFYPVNPSDTEGQEKAYYMSRAVAKGLKREYFVKNDYDKKCAAGENFAVYYENIKPIEGQKFPLLIFSHGFKSYKEGNSFLLSEIASHGYIVISIGHTYASLAETHEGGIETYADKSLSKKLVSPFIPGYIEMIKCAKKKGTPKDLYDEFLKVQNKYCKFNITILDEWTKDTLSVVEYAKDNFSDIIDFNPGIAVSGHSLGGAVAYNLCQKYDEFACGLNIDGGLFGEYEGMTMTKPFFQICSEANVNVETKPLINKTAPCYRALFKKIKHIAFADIKYFIPSTAVTGKIPADLAHSTLCKCHLDFLDKYMKYKDIDISIPDNEFIEFQTF